MSQLHEDLVATRNMLARPGGWVQRRSFNPEGPGACLMGGMIRGVTGCATGLPPHRWQAQAYERYSALYEAAVNHLQDGPVCWNDQAGRTQAEVIALLDEMIADTAPLPDVPELANPETRELVLTR